MRSSENHLANDTYVSTFNRYQELSNNGDIEKESNTGDYVKPKVADSNKSNSGRKNNYDTRITSTNPILHRHKKTQQHVKKHDATAILGDSMVKDLKGWELSNGKQKVVAKSFRGAKTCIGILNQP